MATSGVFPTAPGTGGVNFSGDLVAAEVMPIGKINIGAPGVDLLLSAANPMPARGTATKTPANIDAGMPVRVIGQDTEVCSFSETAANLSNPKMVQLNQGTGVGVTQANGNLLVTTGTTANADWLARSVFTVKSSWGLKYITQLSQRIANNNFAFIVGDLIGENLPVTINSATSITVTKVAHGFTSQSVGQGMFIGGVPLAGCPKGRFVIASVPTADTINFTVAGWPATGTTTATLFGHSHVKVIYNGTSATSGANYDCQRRGWASGDTVLTTLSTANPGHLVAINHEDRSNHIGDINASPGALAQLIGRSSRYQGIPDDTTDMYLFLWAYNGATAPATTTTWTVSQWSLELFALTPVYLAGSKLQSQTNPFPVAQNGTITASVTNATQLPVTPSTTFTNSAATTNPVLIKSSAGTLWSVVASNTSASPRYVKVFNLAAAPVAGTSVPVFTIPLAANGGMGQINGGANGLRFGTGIGITITGGAADLDTTAVGVGEVKVATSFT